MPLYNYRCPYCGYEQEEYRHTFHGRDKAKCKNCEGTMSRAHDKEIPIIRPDIEPGYNMAVGEYVTSRADLRTHMAVLNAASDDMIINSYPPGGRLCKEERAEMLNPKKSPTSEFDITTEGVADYQEIRDYAKDYKTKKGVR